MLASTNNIGITKNDGISNANHLMKTISDGSGNEIVKFPRTASEMKWLREQITNEEFLKIVSATHDGLKRVFLTEALPISALFVTAHFVAAKRFKLITERRSPFYGLLVMCTSAATCILRAKECRKEVRPVISQLYCKYKYDMGPGFDGKHEAKNEFPFDRQSSIVHGYQLEKEHASHVSLSNSGHGHLTSSLSIPSLISGTPIHSYHSALVLDSNWNELNIE